MENAINNFYLYKNQKITNNHILFKKESITKSMLYLSDNYINFKYKMIKSQFNNIKFHHYKDIYIFHNVIDDDLCHQLIELLKKKEKQKEILKEFWKKGNNVQCSFIKLLHFHDLDKKVYDILNKYFRLFVNIHPSCRITRDGGYTLRRIYGKTRRHSDGVREKQTDLRSLSAIVALNSNYDDGIFKFPKQNLQVKLKKGDLILFPPFWTHPHEVSSPSNNTNRFTINCWSIEKSLPNYSN